MKHSKMFVLALLAAAPLLAVPQAETPSAAPKAAPANAPAVLPGGALPTIPLSEIQRGQRGYGLSVFAGTEPERFDVEVIGVMRNVSPDVSYILARLTGKGLETSGVAGGMSGSPVFLDGRLAGAVAFSWPFTNEAIAGITPIESMRELSNLKPMAVPPPPPPVPLADLMAGKVTQQVLADQLARLQARFTGGFANGASSTVQWSASGFGEKSQGLLRQALGTLSSSGKAAPGTVPSTLEPGQAVAMLLVDGDFQLAAYGTVTDHYGDHVLAFGHPVLALGPLRVPMATSEVIMVLSNQNSSFKISNVGEIVGAFEQDRKMGTHGRIGAVAPMIPMTVSIQGERPREFKMRLAEVPEFMPLMAGSSVLAGLESAAYTTGPQSLDLAARVRLRGHGDLEIRQSFDGENAGTEASAYLLSIVAYLVQNPMERVGVESIDVDVTHVTQPQFARLVGANASRTVVRPGDRVALNLDLAAWRGDRFRRSMTVDLPEDLPAGRYSLLVGDGASVDAARLALEPAEPVTFAQALEVLRSFHSRRDLMVLGVYGGAGLSVAGEVMPRLPGSVRSLWTAAPSGGATALKSAVAQVERQAMDVPLQGLVRIDLEVRRKQPLAGEDGGKAPAEQPSAEGVAKGASGEKGGSGEKGRS
ncbi:MAG TPA: SpoIVB peptidase S55 domain-containing protein [Thermoanaerobaculia bacterium]